MNTFRQLLQSAGVRTLAVLLASTVAATGCARDKNRRVVVRLVDLVHGNALSRSTAAYPRIALGDDTRVVLSYSEPTTAITRIHFAAEVTLPHNAVVEFGYGLRASGKISAPVFFTVDIDDGQEVVTVWETQIGREAEQGDGWRDVRVDLSRCSGEVEVTFHTSSATSGIDPSTGRITILPFFSSPVITAPALAAKSRNVILISLDTLRADHLGIYGYDRPTSPMIDRIFADEGLVVEHALSNATDTLRGHTAMLFSQPPQAVLRKQQSWALPRTMPAGLAGALRVEAYRTAAFTEDAYVGAGFGFASGFESYHDNKGIDAQGQVTTAGHIEDTFARGLAWAEANRDQPFFLFLHTYQVHFPYTAPEPFAKLFPSPEAAAEPRLEADLYDREIAYTDAQLGELIAGLAKLGVLDDSLLVVTSDHGEEFGEHGGRYHGAHLHDEVLHVPLLMRAPGLIPASTRRSGPIELLNLAPTILDLLDIAVPDHFTGVSAAEHLRSGAPLKPSPIFSEAWTKMVLTYNGVDKGWIPPSYAVTVWPQRVIRIRSNDGLRYQLYDLASDPGETTDLYGAATLASKQADYLSPEQLVALVDGYEDYVLAIRDRVLTSHGPTQTDDATIRTDKAVEEKLRALGYLQ